MRQLLPLLAVSALVLSTAPAYADLGDQLFKLLPDNGAAFAEFGASVAISDAAAIGGAPFDAGNDSGSGSAYLFDVTTGRQITKLLPNDGAPYDWFGLSVAISGATAIVGAVLDNNDNGEDSGSAYLFDASACPLDFDGDGPVGPSDLEFVLGFWGPNPGHPADLDGDGDVDAADLAATLSNWGSYGSCPPYIAQDFDQDCDVDAADLAQVLSAWGQCP